MYTNQSKNKYAMYLRKSRSDDPDATIEEILNRHYTRLIELANKLNISESDIEIYKEVVSGENLSARPEMQRLLEDIETQKYIGVLVVEVERLARGNSIDQGIIAQAFQFTNTKIITPMKTIDPANEFDQEYFEFGLFMSRREYKTINRRMQEGKQSAVKEGYYLGSIAPYGYKIKRLKKGNTLEKEETEEDATNIILYSIIDDNIGSQAIAKKLNLLGYKTRNGGEWTKAAVDAITLNPIYAGLLRWNYRKTKKVVNNNKISRSRPRNDDYELHKGLHPTYITKEQYELIVSRKKEKSMPRTNTIRTLKNPLATLITCGDCGKKMIRKPYANGRIETLLCNTIGCPNVASDLHIIESRIMESIENYLDECTLYVNNYSEKIITEKNNYAKQIANIDKEIKKLNSQIIKCCEFLETGTYTEELFKDRTNSIKKSISLLEEQKELLAKQSKENKLDRYKKAIPLLTHILEVYDKSSVEEKNNLLKSAIEQCVYKKESSGRWNKAAIDNFSLEINFKI